MIKRMFLMLVVVALFFGGVFGWKAFVARQMGMAMSSQAMPPVTVSTVVATELPWMPLIPAVGTLRAGQGVNVTAQESGIITELRFDSGQEVRAGDLLAQQYVGDAVAHLDGLKADVTLAELNLVRSRDLLDKNLISQFEYDVQKTDRDRAVAMAENLRLVINKKSIRAPFSGRIGIRRVDIGQHVEPGDDIVRLEALDRILVDFPVSQRAVSKVHVGQPIRVRVDAYPGMIFHGTITAVAPQVRSETRDIHVEAGISNPAEQLLPGMFAEVAIELPVVDAVVTLPQSAITFSPYGDSVYRVLDGDGELPTAENVFVTTGETRGDQVAILSGVQPGDTIVSAGQLKLRSGSSVIVNNSVAVSNSIDPAPDNN
jgi:membrane fusion protein (multidrug efflux system)